MQFDTSRNSFDLTKERLFQIAIIAIIATGIVLRASKYLPAFSLRGDELALARNIFNRSLLELITTPLGGEQAAPVGYVAISKILIMVFGNSEYILRLVAFVAGCVSMLLMQPLLTRTNGKFGNLFALSAFAFGSYLVYYSAEFKQYSSDVLICLILLLAFYRHISKETTASDFVKLGILGVLALCFSYPATFVMAGIGITLFLHYSKDRQRLLWISLTGLVWMGTFLALYFFLLRYQTQDSYLITFWDNLLSFMPMPPWRDITWFPKALLGMFFVVAGLSSSLFLVLPIYLLGLWGFWQEKNWQWVLALTIPIGLNVIVSGFQKYPFHGRLILYLLPLLFVVLGKGIDVLMGLIRNRVAANVVFAVLIALLLKPAIATTNSYLVTHSYLQIDIKPVLAFVENNKQDDDFVYLYHNAKTGYIYYAPFYGIENLPYISGQNNIGDAKKYRVELDSLPRGKRIWFIFSYVAEAKVRKGEKRNERAYILNYLKENGTLVGEIYARNNASSAHLFILK